MKYLILFIASLLLYSTTYAQGVRCAECGGLHVKYYRVASSSPITAEIDDSRSVKIGDSFNVYKDSTSIKRVGVVRLCSVSNNTNGNANSRFVKIAGGDAKKSMILIPNQEKGVSLNLGYRYGGISGVMLGADIRLSTKASGLSRHLLVDVSYNPYTDNTYTSSGGSVYPVGNIHSGSFDIGYGYGFRLSNIFGVVASISGGTDYLYMKDITKYNNILEQGGTTYAFSATPSIRIDIALSYPVNFFLGIDYGVVFAKGEQYKEYEKVIKVNHKARGGLGLQMGFKFNF